MEEPIIRAGEPYGMPIQRNTDQVDQILPEDARKQEIQMH